MIALQSALENKQWFLIGCKWYFETGISVFKLIIYDCGAKLLLLKVYVFLVDKYPATVMDKKPNYLV